MTLNNFPEIILDTTLAELLAEESNGESNEALCSFKPCADPKHTTVPTNRKFVITSPQLSDSNMLAHMQLENVNELLSFWAGDMDVVFIACEGRSDDDTLTAKAIQKNAQRAFSIINEKQRPTPKQLRYRVFANSEQLVQHYGGGKGQIRWAFAVDFAEKVNSFIHPEVQYLINTKRWLAECPLKSANDRIIDPECSCAMHTTEQGYWYFGSDCSTCKDAVDKEVTRVEEKLKSTNPPFVLKLTQSLGSVGTWLVKNEEERGKTVETIKGIQKASLPFLTAENASIHPVSLILSDFLPGDMKALNFWVRRDGSVKFLGAGRQLGTRLDGGIQHTTVKWSDQDHLEQRFKNILAEIGQVLKKQGYSGPCGADIVQTDDGTQYVIDLNVRTSTSTILGVLKGHCQKRGFDACGVFECILLSLSREAFEKEFRKELEQGRIILLGTTQVAKKNQFAYPIVITGEDDDTIDALSKRVLGFQAEGIDDAEEAGGG